MLIDAHTHVVSHDEQRYPLAVADLPNGAWWAHARCDADQLLAAMDGAGVDAAVLVQATGPYSYDNRYVVDAHAQHRRRTTAVCTLDIDPRADAGAPDRAAATLDELVRTSAVAGLRLFALDFDGGEGWIADPRTAPVWEQLAALDVPAVPTLFTAQLPALGRMLERFPTVTVCLDHCAFPDFGGGPDAALAGLIELARYDNLLLKVTTAVLSSAPPEALDLLRRHFGAGRMMWGSDYPQAHQRTYPDLVALAVGASQTWSPAEQASFLGATAATVWPR